MTVGGKTIGGPFPGRGEVELVVSGRIVGPQERLEAGVFPQLVHALRSTFGRNAQTGNVALQGVVEDQQIDFPDLYAHFEGAHCGTGCGRVRHEDDRVNGGHCALYFRMWAIVIRPMP